MGKEEEEKIKIISKTANATFADDDKVKRFLTILLLTLLAISKVKYYYFINIILKYIKTEKSALYLF